MERNLKYTVFEEDGAFVARCFDVEVVSEGDTKEEAVANLREALELYFEDIRPYSSTAQHKKRAAQCSLARKRLPPA